MSDVVKQLERSAELVKLWGKCPLPNGKTLAEQLTFDGFSMWEMMSPVMALYYVPVALSAPQLPNLSRSVRPHLSLAKLTVINCVKCLSKLSRSEPKMQSNSGLFLFMGFSGYMYRDVLRPITGILSQKKGFQSLVIHEEFRMDRAPNDTHSTQFDSIWSYCDLGVLRETLRLKQRLAIAIKELQEMQEFPQSIQVDGRPIWIQMKNAFNWLFNFHLPLLLPQVVIARKLLKLHRPALIVSADVADARARIYSLVGRQLNIPSLEIQFGPNGAEGIEWQFCLADRVATWGEVTRQALLKHGLLESKISITGSPRHDSLVNVDPNEVVKTRSRLGVPFGHILVLCASTYQQKEYNALSNPDLLTAMKKAVFKSAGEVQGICLVVKPHPLEDVEETRQLIGAVPNIKFVDPAEDIRELVNACDVFLGFGSTATVDAMIANKLIICPAFPPWVWSDMFVKSDAVLVPRSETEILSIFRRLVSESVGEIKSVLETSRLIFLQKWAYKIDGHSAERVASVAIQMTPKG